MQLDGEALAQRLRAFLRRRELGAMHVFRVDDDDWDFYLFEFLSDTKRPVTLYRDGDGEAVAESYWTLRSDWSGGAPRYRPGPFSGMLELDTAAGERVFLYVHEWEGEYNQKPIVFLAADSLEIAEGLLRELSAFDRRESFRRAAGEICTYPHRSRIPKAKLHDWSALCLEDALERELREEVPRFLESREFYRERGLPFRRGLLLYGPPGTGKSAICQAVARSVEIPFLVYRATPEDEAEGIANIFRQARRLAPSIVCFEDIDVLLPARESHRLSEFLNLLDGAIASEGIFLLATTNHPETLDPALINRPGRFDLCREIPAPGESVRRRFLDRALEWLPEDNRQSLAAQSQGLSFAQIKEACIAANLRCYRNGEKPGMDLVAEQLDAQRNQDKLTKSLFRKTMKIGFVKEEK